ncbi:recombination regulator RecX [Clostridium coskatii]|uniref:Regulatory protein RecX n=1 Tax=Clostridium coskatii TaxID=1705578 RepID=A0A162LEZ3_9CLOT|nr:recombination regulator RecX [Clostridium coskatii]OAA92646.1 Regulatory protein RecX [Clostridium coskatii]OBR94572.1 regulatory protein RecX [Clostridium coskatii]
MSNYTVTKIELQKKNKGRVNVYINEEFAFACSAELVYSYGISKGTSVDMNYLKSIIEEDNFIKCKSCALKIIEKVYKTEKQIKDKLAQKQYDENAISRTIKFLKEYKFVDDDKFTELYIKEKIYSQGKNKIRYSLIKKGISEDIISKKLDLIDEEQEEKAAFNIAQKKYAVLIKSENNIRKVYEKLGNYLARSGYSFEKARAVSDKVIKKYAKLEDEKKESFQENMQEKSKDELYNLASKRYRIMTKSETDRNKIYRRLGEYLLRRGYLWTDIKNTLNELLKD